MFILSPERLRELLIKKATDVMWNRAASKIQNWFLGRLRRAEFLRRVKDTVRATRKIQAVWRHWVKNVLWPRQKQAREEKATSFVQQRLRGYQARRMILLAKANHQAQLLHEHYHRIDMIVKGRFQRRVRKAWLAHKEKKAAKARKKAEEAAAKKNKRPGRRAPAPQAPVATPSKPTAPAAQKPGALKLEKQQTDAGDIALKALNSTGDLAPRRNTTMVRLGSGQDADIMNITM